MTRRSAGDVCLHVEPPLEIRSARQDGAAQTSLLALGLRLAAHRGSLLNVKLTLAPVLSTRQSRSMSITVNGHTAPSPTANGPEASHRTRRCSPPAHHCGWRSHSGESDASQLLPARARHSVPLPHMQCAPSARSDISLLTPRHCDRAVSTQALRSDA